jgi:ceramide glucosyltransferase
VIAHQLALAVEIVTSLLTLAGMGYLLASMLAARVYLHSRRKPSASFAPNVSVLKSLKGLDPGMMDAFRSQCIQKYAGEFEVVFGVSSLQDPAVEAVEQLKAEFPAIAIRLVECPERLGTNGKISTLVQLVEHARFDYLLINDSDITVSPRYLERVMGCFAQPQNSEKATVGLVTALYRGRAHGTLFSRFEAMGISTDFMAGLLVSKIIEGGLHYGLGSTLAVSREALEKSGGLMPLVNYLADDYELGARIAKAGYRVALSAEVVETGIPAYDWKGFVDHQLRWLRTVRDARPGGYAGLLVTHGVGLALLNLIASGVSPLSMWLLGLSFFLRLSQAMMVGAGVLGDHQVLANLWMLPLRDAVAMGLWAAGLTGNTIVWRGEQFVLKNGKLS